MYIRHTFDDIRFIIYKLRDFSMVHGEFVPEYLKYESSYFYEEIVYEYRFQLVNGVL